jgi:hypothetical protein
MILSSDYLKQLKSNQLKNHTSKLIKLQQHYFGMETLHQVESHYMSNKAMHAFVRLCYCVVRYVLSQAGLEDYVCMHTLKVKEVGEKEYDTKSQNSFTSAQKSYMGSNFTKQTPTQMLGLRIKTTTTP